ncbi:MAG: DUF4224 domain-containing protein [Salinisphaera sp.]|nr:DUF4224 domain-containing protein [Salinisphaera sp.]
MTAWLTPAEIQQLTERVRHTAQCRALRDMDIPYRPNAIGRPLVERAAVLRYRDRPGRTKDQPDWSALHDAA